ncbi:MAG: hypothetical protein ACRD29_22015 [Acidimicrobiales bacterium]
MRGRARVADLAHTRFPRRRRDAAANQGLEIVPTDTRRRLTKEDAVTLTRTIEPRTGDDARLAWGSPLQALRKPAR